MAKLKYAYDDLMDPCFQAIKRLGGTATVSEIADEVIKMLKISDEEAELIHRGAMTKLEYRLHWARSWMKRLDIVASPKRGVWSIGAYGKTLEKVDQKEVVKKVREIYLAGKSKQNQEGEFTNVDDDEENGDEELNWKEAVLNAVKAAQPVQFERLCQNLLRLLGFDNVEISGQPGDGGIDGTGTIKVGSVIKFRVVFQCKRYKGNVGSSVIRDFRGSMQGRADKGLLITTARFTKDAEREAVRDGAIAIDLVDGLELAEKLKELRIGVSVEMVEKVSVNAEFFQSL